MNAHRTILVGIGEMGARPIVEWAAKLARPGDVIRMVQTYDPMPYATVDWQLPGENTDLVRDGAARELASAAAALRVRQRGLEIQAVLEDSSVACALRDGSKTADLVVLGSPHRSGSRSALCELIDRATCPILVVGSDHQVATPHPSVTVLVRSLCTDRPAIQAAFMQAHDRGGNLIVLYPWRPQPDEQLFLAEIELQKLIDAYVSEWQTYFPAVGVSVEIRLGHAVSVVRDHVESSELLVMGARPGPGSTRFLDPVLAQVLTVRRGPTLVVPGARVPHDTRQHPEPARRRETKSVRPPHTAGPRQDGHDRTRAQRHLSAISSTARN
jgi:nucleotide-binding universal stress UspA family protein